jgi:nicotinate-nucleotide pyrophosphorylase (carboxylating)
LAFGRQASKPFSPAEAVIQAKEFLQLHFTYLPVVAIEADTLDQLREVLPAAPDVVLLDNMPLSQIVEAVRLRDAIKPAVQLEASGGITLETVRAVAETGVERISVGALTHSAISLDFGLEWKE